MSFDGMAKLYEETRIFDPASFDSALDFLVERFTPEIFRELFEPGIGTGRIAIPLAERGYHVTGIDISQDMLKYLDSRLVARKDLSPMFYRRGDVTRIPFGDMCFDIAITVHLFYFIKEWKQAVNEILRTLKNGAPLVLLHTGTGAEIPSLNQRYKELCSKEGYQIQDVGVKSTREVTDYLIELGYDIELIKDRWRWTQKVNVERAIGYMRSRAYSFTTMSPDNVHLSAIGTLVSELKRQYGTLDIEIEVPNEIYFVFASRLG